MKEGWFNMTTTTTTTHHPSAVVKLLQVYLKKKAPGRGLSPLGRPHLWWTRLVGMGGAWDGSSATGP